MSFCWEWSTHLVFCRGDLCNHSHQPLLGDEKWWKHIMFWWLYVGQTDSNTSRQPNRQTDRQTDEEWADGWTTQQAHRQPDRPTDKLTNKLADWQMDPTHWRTDRLTYIRRPAWEGLGVLSKCINIYVLWKQEIIRNCFHYFLYSPKKKSIQMHIWGSPRSGENILCFNEFMLKSIKTLNVLQEWSMQSLSSAPPWGREVVKTYCVLMTLCWKVSKHLMFCRGDLCNHPHQPLLGDEKWWKHIEFWWLYVEKYQNL